MSNLNVDKEEMKNALAAMQSAIDEFRDIGSNAFCSETDALESMQSFFAERLMITLEYAREWDMDTLIQNLDTFHMDAKTILDDLISTDEAHNVRRVEDVYG